MGASHSTWSADSTDMSKAWTDGLVLSATHKSPNGAFNASCNRQRQVTTFQIRWRTGLFIKPGSRPPVSAINLWRMGFFIRTELLPSADWRQMSHPCALSNCLRKQGLKSVKLHRGTRRCGTWFKSRNVDCGEKSLVAANASQTLKSASSVSQPWFKSPSLPAVPW